MPAGQSASSFDPWATADGPDEFFARSNDGLDWFSSTQQQETRNLAFKLTDPTTLGEPATLALLAGMLAFAGFGCRNRRGHRRPEDRRGRQGRQAPGGWKRSRRTCWV